MPRLGLSAADGLGQRFLGVGETKEEDLAHCAGSAFCLAVEGFSAKKE